MHLNLPIKTRLTLVFTGLMAVVLVAMGMLFYQGIAAQLDRVINAEIAGLAEEFAADFAGGEADVLHDFSVTQSDDYFAQVIDASGQVTETSTGGVSSPLIPARPDAIGATTLFDLDTIVRTGSGPVPVRVAVAPAPGGRIVLVGQTLVARNATLGAILRLLLLCGPAVLLVAGGLGWFLARASLRPVDDLRAQASRISDGNLDHRLAVSPTHDEIARLATTLNDMLSRLQRGVERERRVVDDASHELRTPLGILQTELDLALRKSRTNAELRAALVSAAEVSESLNRLAEDMLVLARANNGQLPILRERTDIALLARDVAASFAGRARDLGVGIEVTAPPELVASIDAGRLRQALGNLIDNALKHSPRGGTVTLRAAVAAAGDLSLSVADTGAGFPADFIPRAFDPYTRADMGRSRRSGGAGLGLAIVKSVIEAHGGSVIAANLAAGGAIVTLRLALVGPEPVGSASVHPIT